MYIKNPDIDTPNGNTIIWRYMGIDKFLHLITEKKLFFSRLSKMTDKYEGSLPEEVFRKRLKQITKNSNEDPFPKIIKERREIEKFRYYTFLNCWTINRNESYALWKIYLSGSTCGIAIKSTVGRLRKSIESIPNNSDFYIGKVNYSKDLINYPPNQFQLTIAKRPYYDYEKELRVFFNYDESVEKKNPIYSELPGWEMDIDIHELIDRIYISPFTGRWFKKSLKEIMQKIDPKLESIIQFSNIKDE